jgi:hypothetical protein
MHESSSRDAHGGREQTHRQRRGAGQPVRL